MQAISPAMLADLDPDPSRPVLVAGPTGSGKSGLALALALARGGVVVNADALQVFAGWPVLTAQPGPEDRGRVPHLLYGHLPRDAATSVGDWLRDVAPILHGARPIIVGGTGLYLSALTEGLATIPPVPAGLRAEGMARLEDGGLGALLADLDAESAARIDIRNPARVLRAWEVLRATGQGIAEWQKATPAPLLPPDRATMLVLDAPPDWLSPRLDRRFASMLRAGALDEARAAEPDWDPARQSSRAIGAAELVAHLRGEMTLEAARQAATVATRQYAKRQRTWFRARMGGWRSVPAQALEG